MKLRTKVLVLLLGSFAVSNTRADDKCNLESMSFVNPSWSFNLDPAPRLGITVTRTGKNGCTLQIGFTPGLSGNSNTRLLRALTPAGLSAVEYNLYRDEASPPYSNIFMDPATSGPPNVIEFSFPDKTETPQSITVYFRPTLKSSASSYSANHIDIVSARLYTVNGNKKDLELTRAFNVSYSPPRILNVSLVDPGAPFDDGSTSKSLAYGILAPGQVRAADAVIQHNVNYRVEISSANGSRMKHQSVDQYVPYTMKVNGLPFALSTAPATLSTGTGVSTGGGARHPLIFEIGTFGGVAAGAYSDTLTLSVIAN